MTRSELEHAIRAACDVSGDSELWVFGSQAILGSVPDAPAALRQSREVEVCPKNHPEKADLIDGALGELSRFDHAHGFYVHGLTIDGVKLPPGWEERTVTVRNPATRMFAGHCLEIDDLAVSKLVAFRDRDREFVRTLLQEGLADSDVVRERLGTVPIAAEHRDKLLTWLDATCRELDS